MAPLTAKAVRPSVGGNPADAHIAGQSRGGRATSSKPSASGKSPGTREAAEGRREGAWAPVGSASASADARGAAQGERQMAAAAASHGRNAPAVAEVDRRVFARILLTYEMLNHHLPDSYLEALQQL